MDARSAYRLAFRNSLLLVIGVLLFALSTTRVLHLGTTDNWCDRKRPLLGFEKRVAGALFAGKVFRFGPKRPHCATPDSGNALGSGLTKGI